MAKLMNGPCTTCEGRNSIITTTFSCRNSISASALALTSPLLSSVGRSTTNAQAATVLKAKATATAKAIQRKKVLIVNTDSGGHAVIGFWFARELASAGHDVTIFTDGEKNSPKMSKPPFSLFDDLVKIGIQTIWGSPNKIQDSFGTTAFDVVLDNNGKDMNSSGPVADWAKGIGAEQFLYISSAGIYKPTSELPHVEGDITKSDAGHLFVEQHIESLSFKSWFAFRPQYIIGSGNNKDCEEWFFDRIVRHRPIPIPGSGMQLTNITHVRDIASMLMLAVDNPEFFEPHILNAVSDRAITFDGLAKLCATIAGKEAKIIHYDPGSLGINARAAFPFRNMHFYAEPRTAKAKWGWKSSTYLPEDLKERFQEYLSIGRDKWDMQFEVDDKILGSLKL